MFNQISSYLCRFFLWIDGLSKWIHPMQNFVFITFLNLIKSASFRKKLIKIVASIYSVFYPYTSILESLLVDLCVLIKIFCFSAGFDSVFLLSFWWFLNGMANGPGWTSIGRILKAVDISPFFSFSLNDCIQIPK